MGKIVKYCNSCDEGFAAKFTFCPDCGKTLESFEMNPVQASSAPAESVAVPVTPEPADILEIPKETVQNAVSSNGSVERPIIEVAPPTTKIVASAKTVVNTPPIKKTETSKTASPDVFHQTKPLYADRKPRSLEEEHDAYASDGNFYVTVIEEKNVKQRNTLLLGSLCLIMFSLMSGLVYNIFSKDLEVGAINEDTFLASLIDDVPMDVEEERQQKLDKNAGGGGGGGGDNDPRPASQGERPPMRTNPEFAPSATSERLTNPTIPIQQSIKGPIDEKFKGDSRYGVKFGAVDPSNGPGSGGGIGTGRDGGVGPGSGPGYGPGSNGGLGGGNNGGIGPGDGPGGDTPPPPRPVGVTQGIKILSKPQPKYTDPARQNQLQGQVTLRVMFLANGEIGSITTVSGLGYGLTEQAIAAARQIRFEPAKRDGVPVNSQRTIQYSFNMY